MGKDIYIIMQGEGKRTAMQQTIRRSSSPVGPNQNGPRSQTIIITAITLFAISGLLVGFTFGALTRPPKPTTHAESNTKSTPITVPRAATPTPTQVVQSQPLGIPKITNLSSIAQIADNTTTYTISAHPTDKAGNQVHSGDVTCKVWLTKDANINDTLGAANDQLKKIDTLSQPLPNEELGALTFGAGSQQTEKCNASGETTWTYTIAPTLTPGNNYRLIILTDWSGQHWNWSYTQFLQIGKAN
jgi:hypothetical protein